MSRTGTGTRLVDAYPWARDQWADDPDLLLTINVSSPTKVKWRCPEGHEFVETPPVRVGNQAWKRGQIDACPYCLRQRYFVTYRCGHTQEYRASSAEETPERHAAAAQADCYPCRPKPPPGEVFGTPENRAAWREAHPLPSSGLTPGDVQQARNTVTSVIEEKVRDAVRAAGHKVPKGKMAVLCHHPNPEYNVLSLTPDIVLVKHKIAIEVDPCGTSDYGHTHTGQEDEDHARNELLQAVGWAVIRLRLGASDGAQIGDRDVVVESTSFTKDAEAALREAIDDKIADRPAQVRLVKKKPAGAKPQRRSTVVNIRSVDYTYDGHYFTWFPSLDSPDKYRLRLCVGGRYLYTDTNRRDNFFIAEVGLHEVPRREWRKNLEVAMKGKDPVDLGTTRWPWGDALIEAVNGHPDGQTIVGDCWTNIDMIEHSFTTNADTLAHCDPSTLSTQDGTPVVRLHPAAIDLGYRFASLELLTGYKGPYQRIVIIREPDGRTD